MGKHKTGVEQELSQEQIIIQITEKLKELNFAKDCGTNELLWLMALVRGVVCKLSYIKAEQYYISIGEWEVSNE